MASDDEKSQSEKYAKEMEKAWEELRARLVDVSNSRTQADQDARQAAQAKTHTEDHANQIAKLKGAAEVDAAAIAAFKKNADEIYQAIAAAKPKVQADLEAVAAAVVLIKEDQERVDVHERAIGDLEKQIEEIRVKSKAHQDSLAASLKVAETSSEKISDIEDKVISVSESITATNDEWTGMLGEAKQAKKGLDENYSEAKARLVEMAAFVDLSNKSMEKVAEYQTKLAELQEGFLKTKKTIEDLLPGATSSGLAASFMEQKKRFIVPKRIWLGAFVASVVALIALAWFGVTGQVKEETHDWDVVLRFLVQRLPIVVPLVWLAIYAGRQYSIAARIEEDYAYKEALSRAFEGYKREMDGISKAGHAVDPLIVLCTNVLGALAERPGRIYEAKHDDATPMQAAGDALEKLLERTKGWQPIPKVGEEIPPKP